MCYPTLLLTDDVALQKLDVVSDWLILARKNSQLYVISMGYFWSNLVQSKKNLAREDG